MIMSPVHGISNTYDWSSEEPQELFEEIRMIMKRRKNYNSIIRKAFVFAEKHYQGNRLTGEPILCHNLRAGLTLAQAGFKYEYILLAILKDVIRKGTATEEDLRRNFYESLVDEVLLLNKDPKKINKMNHGRTDYIVLATRLDNLRTMDSFEFDRQMVKIRHTKDHYLKIATKQNSEFFVSRIQDAFFYIESPTEYQAIVTKQNNILASNMWAIQNVKAIFEKLEKTPEIHQYTILKTLPNAIKQFSEFQKKENFSPIYIPTCDIRIVIKEEFVWNAVPIFMRFFQNELADKSWYILNHFHIPDEHNPEAAETFYLLQDSFGINYRFIIEGELHYNKTQFGLLEKVPELFSSSKNEDNGIHVFLPDGLKIKLPEGSTVLDAAFYVHESLGIHAVNATINGRSTPVDLSVHLEENWTIKINRSDEPQVTPAWITKVRTKKALRALANYFETYFQK